MTEPPAESAVGWWLPSEAAAAWPDAARLDAVDLERMLKVAHEQCVDYGPTVRVADSETGELVWAPWDGSEPVPERFREAQLLQARAVWNFERTGGGDVIGPEGTTVRVYPMGWQVKSLLRPDTGEPVIV